MINNFISRIRLGDYTDITCEYIDCINDLLSNEMVRSMENYVQHGSVDRLTHCIYVSLLAYHICKRSELDFRSAARGGLLHDFFLYDWHEENLNGGAHGITHPRIALKNADQYFILNDLEREIIRKHMWPLTIALPKHAETYVVLTVDKYCAFMEVAGLEKVVSLKNLTN